MRGGSFGIIGQKLNKYRWNALQQDRCESCILALGILQNTHDETPQTREL